MLEIDATDASLQQIREQEDQLLKQETEAQLALAKVGGGDAALLAEAKRQEALAQMASWWRSAA